MQLSQKITQKLRFLGEQDPAVFDLLSAVIPPAEDLTATMQSMVDGEEPATQAIVFGYLFAFQIAAIANDCAKPGCEAALRDTILKHIDATVRDLVPDIALRLAS